MWGVSSGPLGHLFHQQWLSPCSQPGAVLQMEVLLNQSQSLPCGEVRKFPGENCSLYDPVTFPWCEERQWEEADSNPAWALRVCLTAISLQFSELRASFPYSDSLSLSQSQAGVHVHARTHTSKKES